MQYNVFSKFYDLLTKDVDYKSRTEYLCKLFERFDRMPTLLLDVGCGTGSFSLEFAKKGIDVIAADPSTDMLNIARKKAQDEGKDILFLNQSGQELDLYGTVDGAVCCLDTINHIVDKRTLQRFLNRVSLFLEPQRLFIFDVNTLYKQQKVLGDNTFVYETDDVYCVWQNYFDKSTKTTDIFLDFFAIENGSYNRYSEEFSERVYTQSDLKDMLKKAGLNVKAIYAENTFKKPTEKTQRIVFVTGKE